MQYQCNCTSSTRRPLRLQRHQLDADKSLVELRKTKSSSSGITLKVVEMITCNYKMNWCVHFAHRVLSPALVVTGFFRQQTIEHKNRFASVDRSGKSASTRCFPPDHWRWNPIGSDANQFSRGIFSKVMLTVCSQRRRINGILDKVIKICTISYLCKVQLVYSSTCVTANLHMLHDSTYRRF